MTDQARDRNPIPTILIVDDDPDNLDFLQSIFKVRGYEVITEAKSVVAYETASHHMPDVILLDMMMPGLNGFQVCKLLKADATLHDIPVMFLSAIHEQSNIIQAFEAGAVDYITKPFRVAEVIARVEVHLTNYRQRQEIRYLLRHAEQQNMRLRREVRRREKAEIDLRANEDRLRSITESASDAIVSCDDERRIVFWNTRAEKMFGKTRVEVLGERLETIVPELADGTPFAHVVDEMLQPGQAISYAVHEAAAQDADGRWLPVEVSLAKWRADDGVFFTAVLRDVTERKAAEIASREQELLLNALRETVMLELNRSLDLDTVLESILNNLGELIPFTAANIMLIENDDVLIPIERGFAESKGIGVEDLPLLSEVTDRMALTMIDDVDEWSSRQHVKGNSRGMRSYMGMPIVLRDEIIGLLNLYSEYQAYFTAEHGEYLQVFANQAAVAIRNARRFADAKVTARQQERQHLARELHDAVSQLLFSANVIAESLPSLIERKPEVATASLGDLSRMTRGALAEMRKLLLELRPTALRDSEMGELMHHLGNALVGRYGGEIVYEIKGGDHRLPEPVQLAFYRVAQEALNNIVKHARAETITIGYTGGNGCATLRISDDGKGFERDKVPTNHYGLAIMAERADDIGAAFSITTAPGNGTHVQLEWEG